MHRIRQPPADDAVTLQRLQADPGDEHGCRKAKVRSERRRCPVKIRMAMQALQQTAASQPRSTEGTAP
jgi:hypothetical protein